MSSQEPESVSEISLLDIVNFVQESWKKLLAASIVGAVLGLTGWFFLGSYQAEYVLFNNSSIDLVGWKNLQKSLPNLAEQIVEENKVPQDYSALYKAMAEPEWWQKNVSISYALSKADTKDLGAISKDFESATTTIISLTLTTKGFSKKEAIGKVRTVNQFLRSGSAYLLLHNLLNGYESQTISAVAELQQKITNTHIEMGYQQERAKSLEDLHKRFPGGSTTTGQVVDPKDSGAKYMPISTQIIAVNNDINASKESLARLTKRLEQIAIIKTFIDQAIPLRAQTFDGLVLNEKLLVIESALRSKLVKGDSNSQVFLDQLHAQLLSIKERFTKGLEANTAPVAIKKGMLKTTAGGLAGGFFLMLLGLLGQRVWTKTKNGSAQ